MPGYRYSGISEQSRAAAKRYVDAVVLRENQRWGGAMYVFGYAFESALKARLMERYRCVNLEQLSHQLSHRFGHPIDARPPSDDGSSAECIRFFDAYERFSAFVQRSA